MKHKEKRQHVRWGTYCKNPIREEYTLVKIADLSDEHIYNILRTQDHIHRGLRFIFCVELSYRKVNRITIEAVDNYDHIVSNY